MGLEYTQLYKILSEVSRRRILAVLNEIECSVQDLQDILSLGQSSISAHLAQLRTNELVDYRKQGRFVLYRLALGNNKEIDAFLEIILNVLPHEEWYDRDARKLKKLISQRAEMSLSFYEGIETQNKRSPGQTDHSLAIGLLRCIRNKTIVDIGCGSGRLAVEFSKMNNTVIGLDADLKQIEIAKKTFAEAIKKYNIKFIQGKGEEIKQDTASVDLVIFSHSLHHIESPDSAIKESARILKKNGLIIILDLTSHEETWMQKVYGDYHLGFDSNQIINLLKQNGFESINIDIDASDIEFPQFESLIITAQR